MAPPPPSSTFALEQRGEKPRSTVETGEQVWLETPPTPIGNVVGQLVEPTFMCAKQIAGAALAATRILHEFDRSEHAA